MTPPRTGGRAPERRSTAAPISESWRLEAQPALRLAGGLVQQAGRFTGIERAVGVGGGCVVDVDAVPFIALPSWLSLRRKRHQGLWHKVKAASVPGI